ncbi:unnamed protein product [Rhodiola kirilowii]
MTLSTSSPPPPTQRPTPLKPQTTSTITPQFLTQKQEHQEFERKLFEERLCKFLIKVSHIKKYPEKVGLSDGRILIERFGNSMGRDVAGLVMDGCVLVENLDWIEALILNKLVPHFSYTKLIDYLVEKRRSDLICEFVKNSSDLKAGDILTILRYFLVPSKEARSSMSVIRKEWEREAIEAADRVSKFTLLEMKVAAKERAVLLMMAYDGFSDSELCLHYLFAVISVDELVWTSAICKLNGKEMMALIGYLGKWLRKYNRFPQAVSCPEASLRLKLKAVNWLPKIKDIVNCLGLVIDEHFSTLVLHKEFHDEMRSLDGLVGSLVLEARLCCSLSNVVETLKSSELLRWADGTNGRSFVIDLPGFKKEEVNLEIDHESGNVTIKGRHGVGNNRFRRFSLTVKAPEDTEMKEIVGDLEGGLETVLGTESSKVMEKAAKESSKEAIADAANQRRSQQRLLPKSQNQRRSQQRLLPKSQNQRRSQQRLLLRARISDEASRDCYKELESATKPAETAAIHEPKTEDEDEASRDCYQRARISDEASRDAAIMSQKPRRGQQRLYKQTVQQKSQKPS